MENMLTVEHLSVQFGVLEVLHDLSFGVPKGSALAVIGPNGSGKAVLFQSLIGSVAPQDTVRWALGSKDRLCAAETGHRTRRAWLHRPSGPMIVMVAAAFFLVNLLRSPAN